MAKSNSLPRVASQRETAAKGTVPRGGEAEKTRSAGRPRSEEVRRVILQATIDLLQDVSLQAITIEAIAKSAGVSKATIYRWWDSKALVVIDAFIEHHVIRTPMRRDLPPGEAIALHMRALVEQYSGWGGRIVAQILAEAQSDPAVGREFRARFHYGRRAIVREVLNEWRSSGEIDPDTDIEMLMDVLYSPIYMRLLVGHAPLDERFITELQDYVFPLLRRGTAPEKG
jgi:AcrR family transcriptional regulator